MPCRESMRMTKFRPLRALVAAAIVVAACGAARAADQPPIRIGQTMPYSGPASSYAVAALAQAAYFKMLNARGGVNGRPVEFMSVDDAYSPPKTVEQTRRLVENENVLLMFQSLGTATNSAVQKYLNAKHVPQLFVGSGATRFGDPGQFPWTMGWAPSLASEARSYARYVLSIRPQAKIAILWQSDDLGRDALAGFRDGVAERQSAIVKEVSFETADPTVDSQILLLKASGADVVALLATPKATAQALRRISELDWKPLTILLYNSSSIAGVLQPVGLKRVQGVVSSTYLKDPEDPRWRDDPAVAEWRGWMAEFNPAANTHDFLNVYGYSVAQTLEAVLRKCGNDLSRENIMRQAAQLDIGLPMLLPGIHVRTSQTDYRPIKQMELRKFEGDRWKPIEGLASGE
jgi:branched-chain amino acid transport system substrate-binding protein